MSSVDLVTLRLLITIDELGSINAAAQRMGISQPAASARLREFEARWQVPIAVRTPRGTALTEVGRTVVGWAAKVMAEVEVMESGLQAFTAKPECDLDVAASLTVAEFLLPRWMSRLQSTQPGVRPHLRVVNSEAVIDTVGADLASLGFIENAQTPPGFECRILGYDTVVVAVRSDHPWARRTYPLTVDQLLAASFVLREPGSGIRSTFERALRHEPKVAIEASATQTLVGAAVAGLGPAVLSGLAIRPHLEQGQLVAVPTVLDLRRPFTAIWKRGRRLSTPARDLLAIATSFADLESTTRISHPPAPRGAAGS
jgi:DNA-binding transcriptional LysR family regulator